MKALSNKSSQNSPERTCVVCRKQKSQKALLRIVLDENNVAHVDYLNKLPGRGAYVCPSLHCIQKASQRGSFSRAFKQTVTVEAGSLIAEAKTAAKQQIRSLLSLANRANFISAGHSRVERTLREESPPLLIIAQDASKSVKQKFENWGLRMEIPIHFILTQLELAPCVGYPTCSLLTINDSGFAQKLNDEIQRANQLNFTSSPNPQTDPEKENIQKHKQNRTHNNDDRSKKHKHSFSKSIH